jgi:hypothetical protein
MCRPWDGWIFQPGLEIPLPAHPNCMCGYEPVPPDTPVKDIDWDQVADDTRQHWIYHVAYLLREGLAVPPVLLPLQDEAEAHNRGRENVGAGLRACLDVGAGLRACPDVGAGLRAIYSN